MVKFNNFLVLCVCLNIEIILLLFEVFIKCNLVIFFCFFIKVILFNWSCWWSVCEILLCLLVFLKVNVWSFWGRILLFLRC